MNERPARRSRWSVRTLAALPACLAIACGGGSSAPTGTAPSPPTAPTQELRGGGVTVVYQAADAAWAPVVHGEAVDGRENALRFFGAPLPGELRIDVFPDRASLNVHWRQRFGGPSECWMIAGGDPGGVVMLSPGAWARDSCGHDGQDAVHRSRVTFHEVVHVHHARHSPAWGPTAGAVGWFVEGLAVHASGQLDAAAQAFVRREAVAGRAPPRLSQVLPAGYNWAGSLVAWIDRRHGRAALLDLLDETDEAGVLRRLETTEPALLAGWLADVREDR